MTPSDSPADIRQDILEAERVIDAAPKHLPFGIRVAVNLNRGLTPDAGFDEDDYRQMRETTERFSQAMTETSVATLKAAAGMGAAATALGRALAAPRPAGRAKGGRNDG